MSTKTFDFAACKAKAKTMTIAELQSAINDCQEILTACEADPHSWFTSEYYHQMDCFNQEWLYKATKLVAGGSNWICNGCCTGFKRNKNEIHRFNFCPDCGVKI